MDRWHESDPEYRVRMGLETARGRFSFPFVSGLTVIEPDEGDVMVLGASRGTNLDRGDFRDWCHGLNGALVRVSQLTSGTATEALVLEHMGRLGQGLFVMLPSEVERHLVVYARWPAWTLISSSTLTREPTKLTRAEPFAWKGLAGELFSGERLHPFHLLGTTRDSAAWWAKALAPKGAGLPVSRNIPIRTLAGNGVPLMGVAWFAMPQDNIAETTAAELGMIAGKLLVELPHSTAIATLRGQQEW